MKKLLLIGLMGLLLVAVTATPPAAAQPLDQSADQYHVIDLVNGLRAEYGLPPYQINAQLMAAAQAHSEWAASIGTHSHTGAGGSTPTDRAVAAGYGGGRAVRVSENIYWGTLASAESALQWWRNSPIHFRGMTSTNYIEIGAGVAYAPSGGYFTLLFGAVVGDAPLPTSPPAAGQPSAAPLPVFVVEPVEVAEPNEDGSIVHVVGEGQNVWDIAEAYEVAVSEILALNRLSEDSLIHPGDELIIMPAPVQPAAEIVGPYYHTVEQGQTLFGIALSYGKDLPTILELNGLTQDSIIHPGDQILIVPDPNATPTPRPPLFHVVQAGQTLIGIAFYYGIDLETLYALNGLTPDSIIHPGDQILVRPGDPTPAPTPTITPTPPPTPTALPGALLTATAQARPTATPTADAAASSEPRRGADRPVGRALLIGLLVVVALAGVGLVVYGAVFRLK